jgi:hypothetical protein
MCSIGPKTVSEVAIGIIVLASSGWATGAGSVMFVAAERAVAENALMELLNFDPGVWRSSEEEDLRSFLSFFFPA